jgi:DNA-binding MarR family transcriptional regulator
MKRGYVAKQARQALRAKEAAFTPNEKRAIRKLMNKGGYAIVDNHQVGQYRTLKRRGFVTVKPHSIGGAWVVTLTDKGKKVRYKTPSPESTK